MLYYQCKLCVRLRGNCNAAWHNQSTCDKDNLLPVSNQLFIVSCEYSTFSNHSFMKSHGNGWLEGWIHNGSLVSKKIYSLVTVVVTIRFSCYVDRISLSAVLISLSYSCQRLPSILQEKAHSQHLRTFYLTKQLIFEKC